MHRVRTQQDVVQKLEEWGVAVSLRDYDQSFVSASRKKAPSWKSWLVKHLGIDHFSSVVQIRLSMEEGIRPPLSGVVDQLCRLPQLRELHLAEVGEGPNKFGAKEFRQICRLVQVERVNINRGEVTGEILEPLAKMSNLRDLHITHTDPYPDDLAYQAMGNVESLRWVSVPDCSQNQRELLARLRPDIALESNRNYSD